MLKKINIICILSLIVLGGCQEKINTSWKMSGDNSKQKVESINRLTSANEIVQDGSYEFLLASKVTDDKIDTYKLTDNLKITANDKDEYTLTICKDKSTDVSKCEQKKFKDELTITTSSPKYYVLTSENGKVDVTISTMTDEK